MRRPLAALALAGAVLLASGCLSASVRGWAADNHERLPDEGTAEVYRADGPPSRVAAELADAREPAERRVTPSGVFLRYRNDLVAVVPNPGGGSRILIENERNGYATFFPFVGGYWGTFGGPGETFRGGGPGAGK